jgi:type I restriction enzyme M protein
VLTPGHYVGAGEAEDDGKPFAEKMACLTAEFHAQTAESARLNKLIWANLKDIGYGK